MELFQLIRLKLTRGSRLREMIETWFVHRPTPFPSFSLPYLFCDHCRSCSRDFSSSRLSFHLWRDDFSGENIARNLSRWSRIHSRIVSRYDVPSSRWLLAELNERERDWKSWFGSFELLIKVSGLGRVQLFLYFLVSIVLRLLCKDDIKCQWFFLVKVTIYIFLDKLYH